MKLAALEKRRARLNYEIAKAISFQVCIKWGGGYYPLGEIRNASPWINKRYSFAELPKPTNESELWQDFYELDRRDWISFSPNQDRDAMGGICYVSDPLRWRVGLKRDGVDAALDYETPWWKKAYEKEPVTAIQVVATVLFTVLGFVGGWVSGHFIGKKAETKPEETKIVQPEKSSPSTQPATTRTGA